MDKKLLDALNNVSTSLEILADALGNKNKAESDVGKALQAGNFATQLNSIDVNVKQLKEDTKQILKNQKTLLEIAKSKKENTPFEIDDNRRKESIRSGVSTILLIATGVLAIGSAFKLIGEVDFASVISLSIAIPLLASSFTSISNMSGLKMSDLGKIMIIMTSLATTLVGTSYILSNMKIIRPDQLLTTVAIAGAFALMSSNIGKMSQGISKVSILDTLKMPIIFIALAGSITASSYLLANVSPIGIPQLLTSIAIGGVFTILSYGLSKLTSNIAGISLESVITIPLVMLTMSQAIAWSSNILNTVTPLSGGLPKYLTIAGIAGIMVILGYAIKPISSSLSNINIAKALTIPIIMTAMSGAIMLSSKILNETSPIDASLLFNITLQSLTLAGIALTLSIPAMLISKIGISSVMQGAITIPIIAGAIMASSLLLSLGDYSKGPSIGWTIGTGLSLMSFGLTAVALGIIATTGVGAVALLAGGAAVIGLAGVILATDAILSTGTFTGGPSLSWATSVGLSLGAFSLVTMALGTAITGTLGIGAIALATGSLAIISIAESIVKVSDILRKGTYTGGPTEQWASGIGSALSAFAPVYLGMMANNFLSIFGMGVSPDSFTSAIVTISQGITKAGEIFANSPSIWKNGPSEEWAKGVGGAISSFAPVFKALDKGLLDKLFGGGVSPSDMNTAILTIADGIITAGEKFRLANGVWTSPPTKEWADSVGQVINSFTDVYKLGSGVFGTIDTDDIEDYNMIIAGKSSTYSDNDYSIINSIIKMGIKLGNYNFKPINSDFVSSLSKNLSDYVKLTKDISGNDTGNSISNIDKLSASLYISSLSLDKMSTSIEKLSNSLSKLDVSKLNALKNFTGMSIVLASTDTTKFNSMMDAFEKRTELMKGIFEKDSFRNYEASNSGTQVVRNIVNIQKNQTGKSIDDLYDIMSKMIPILNSISKTNSNISTAADEQRNNNKIIKRT